MDNSGKLAKHSIQVVANRTGLSADVIRAWERRYGAVNPQRSGTHRRLYSDEEIQRLMLLRKATLAGRRIGDVAQLPVEELAALVKEDSEAQARLSNLRTGSSLATPAAAYLDHALEATSRLDSRDLERLLDRAATELDITTLFDGVLSPLLRQIGDRWLEGSWSIAHEHMTSAIVRALLDSLRAGFSNPTAEMSLISTTPAGEHHELGALKISVIASLEGWRSTFLGCNLPAREIASAATDLDADVVALSMVFPERDRSVEDELEQLGRLLQEETRLIVGGEAAYLYAPQLSRIGARHCRDLSEFRDELRRLASENDGIASGGK